MTTHAVPAGATPDYTYQALVQRWVDGDTVWLNVDLGFRMYSVNDFRSYGINAPERSDHPAGDNATARCNELAPAGSLVTVQTYKNPDKYGRWLAVVFNADGVNVNQTLVDEGLAVPYFGHAV